MLNLTYNATIDEPDDTDRCVCGNCGEWNEWQNLIPIEDATLTPGDPSPAGRCPETGCNALCYMDRTKDRAESNAMPMLKALRDLVSFADHNNTINLTGKLAKAVGSARKIIADIDRK